MDLAAKSQHGTRLLRTRLSSVEPFSQARLGHDSAEELGLVACEIACEGGDQAEEEEGQGGLVSGDGTQHGAVTVAICQQMSEALPQKSLFRGWLDSPCDRDWND